MWNSQKDIDLKNYFFSFLWRKVSQLGPYVYMKLIVYVISATISRAVGNLDSYLCKKFI